MGDAGTVLYIEVQKLIILKLSLLTVVFELIVFRPVLQFLGFKYKIKSYTIPLTMNMGTEQRYLVSVMKAATNSQIF